MTFYKKYVLYLFMLDQPVQIDGDAAQPDLERAGERLVVLRRLSQLGMDLAQALRDRFVDADPPPPVASGVDPILSFTRVARAVRQGLALEVRLEDERRALGEKTQAAAAAARAEALARAADEKREQIRARNQAVWKVLRPEIEAATLSVGEEGRDDDAGDNYADDYDDEDDLRDDEFYALTGALHERLTDTAEHEDFLMRPVEAIIDEIRQALGLGAQDDEASDAARLRPAARRTRSEHGAPGDITAAGVEAAWRQSSGAAARVETG